MSQKSITQQRWEIGQCRIEEGIFFGDDQVVLFSNKSERQLTKTKILTLTENEPDSWTEIDIEVECISQKYGLHIKAGGGAWEGEGFVAACRIADESLHWLIHLNDSEAFTKLEIRGDEIFAVAEEYPMSNEWIIPIHAPENIRKIY